MVEIISSKIFINNTQHIHDKLIKYNSFYTPILVQSSKYYLPNADNTRTVRINTLLLKRKHNIEYTTINHRRETKAKWI